MDEYEVYFILHVSYWGKDLWYPNDNTGGCVTIIATSNTIIIGSEAEAGKPNACAVELDGDGYIYIYII